MGKGELLVMRLVVFTSALCVADGVGKGELLVMAGTYFFISQWKGNVQFCEEGTSRLENPLSEV